MEIRQIDALVHPDFGVLFKHLDPREIAMRPQWDQRIEKLADTYGGILFYFSAFPLELKDDTEFPEESKRRAKYKSLLGDRMFLFDAWDRPNTVGLWFDFRKRGFRFDPNSTILTTYGEYYHECVANWLKYTQEALGLPDSACSRDPLLSVGTEDQPFKLSEFLQSEPRQSVLSTLIKIDNASFKRSSPEEINYSNSYPRFH